MVIARIFGRPFVFGHTADNIRHLSGFGIEQPHRAGAAAITNGIFIVQNVIIDVKRFVLSRMRVPRIAGVNGFVLARLYVFIVDARLAYVVDLRAVAAPPFVRGHLADGRVKRGLARFFHRPEPFVYPLRIGRDPMRYARFNIGITVIGAERKVGIFRIDLGVIHKKRRTVPRLIFTA